MLAQRKKAYRLSKVIAVTVMLSNACALAQNEARDGIAAFSQGNYERALELFEVAESSAPASDSLHYNIAVSLFRLGRYEEAKQRFNLIKDKPEWKVLVGYNLGLVAEAQQDNANAQRLFQESVQQDENEQVRTLAQQKLQATEQQTATAAGLISTRSTAKRWAALVSISGGEDSNASSLADELLESGRNANDYFHELLLYSHVQALGTQGNGLRIYALGFDRSFNTFDNLNSQVLGLGTVFEKPLGSFQIEAGLRMTRTLLDSNEVADQLQASLGVSRKFDIGTLNVNYSSSQFDAGEDFQQIDGDRQQAELGWRKQISRVNLRARYIYETNSRQNLQRGGAFASYSPERYTARLEAVWQVTSKLSAGLTLEQIESEYDGSNRLRESNGAIKEAVRESTQGNMKANISYRFNDHWKVKAEYQYADQKDNFDIYNYEKHRLLGSIEFQL